MGITINGSSAAGNIDLGTNGTIADLAVGGVPDGTIDADALASNAVTNAKVADDAIDSAEIADGAVDLAHLSASGTASSSTFLRGDNSWAAAGGGKVLQWKSITRNGNQRVTNNDKDTWTDGNIPLAITPASTDSRILIMLNLHVGLYYGTAGYQSKPGNNIGIKIYKTVGGTDTDIQADGPDASGFYTYRMAQNSTTDQSDVWSFKTGYIARSIIHHPNTTSEVTFKVAIKSGFDGNTVACNDSGLSTLVLLELENNS